MRILLAGVAAIALSLSPAVAEPGGTKGGGGGNPHGQHGQAHGSPAKAAPANARNGQGSKGPVRSFAEPGGRNNDRAVTQKGNGDDKGPIGPASNAGGKNKSAGPDSRDTAKGNRKSGPMPAAVHAQDRVEKREAATDRALNTSRSSPTFRWSQAPARGLVDGCPPGLAKKDNGCMPPGQVRNDPWRGLFSRPGWWGYRDWRDGRVAYYDGYLLRLNGERVASYIPLLGGALAVGGLWPDYYQPVVLPPYYQDFYGLGPSYRYADNVLYRVDADTLAISSIAALLTGDDIVVGQRLPDYYGVYNVPYAYRSRYVDGPDALYRYSDGYVYRVDPATHLVQAAIELLL